MNYGTFRADDRPTHSLNSKPIVSRGGAETCEESIASIGGGVGGGLNGRSNRSRVRGCLELGPARLPLCMVPRDFAFGAFTGFLVGFAFHQGYGI